MKDIENLTMSRWQKQTNKWKQKLNKDDTYLKSYYVEKDINLFCAATGGELEAMRS